LHEGFAGCLNPHEFEAIKRRLGETTACGECPVQVLIDLTLLYKGNPRAKADSETKVRLDKIAKAMSPEMADGCELLKALKSKLEEAFRGTADEREDLFTLENTIGIAHDVTAREKILASLIGCPEKTEAVMILSIPTKKKGGGHRQRDTDIPHGDGKNLVTEGQKISAEHSGLLWVTNQDGSGLCDDSDYAMTALLRLFFLRPNLARVDPGTQTPEEVRNLKRLWALPTGMTAALNQLRGILSGLLHAAGLFRDVGGVLHKIWVWNHMDETDDSLLKEIAGEADAFLAAKPAGGVTTPKKRKSGTEPKEPKETKPGDPFHCNRETKAWRDEMDKLVMDVNQAYGDAKNVVPSDSSAGPKEIEAMIKEAGKLLKDMEEDPAVGFEATLRVDANTLKRLRNEFGFACKHDDEYQKLKAVLKALNAPALIEKRKNLRAKIEKSMRDLNTEGKTTTHGQQAHTDMKAELDAFKVTLVNARTAQEGITGALDMEKFMDAFRGFHSRAILVLKDLKATHADWKLAKAQQLLRENAQQSRDDDHDDSSDVEDARPEKRAKADEQVHVALVHRAVQEQGAEAVPEPGTPTSNRDDVPVIRQIPLPESVDTGVTLTDGLPVDRMQTSMALDDEEEDEDEE